MLATLEEALKLRQEIAENNANGIRDERRISIIREVRYYASFAGGYYTLEPDWTSEDLERKLGKLDNQ